MPSPPLVQLLILRLPLHEYGLLVSADGTHAMTATHTGYGIPDVELTKPDGGTVNPNQFVGHELVVLFYPTAEAAAAREMADYTRHAQDLCDSDAWIIGVGDNHERDGGGHAETKSFAMVRDPGQRAWTAFQDLLERTNRTPRRAGAVFLFDRGGGLRQSWAGCGHAIDVVRALAQRR